jgi:pimeloyl-ACP methyl ester carboxylesterase
MEEVAMLREQIVNLGAVTINFAEGPPSGPPLVLLHGGGDRWQYLLPMIPSLALRWHLFALDLRGHGKSGRVPGAYRPEHYVADVIAWVDQHLTEPAILLGHSLGGWVALMATAQRTEQVRALILGDPPLNIERFLAIEGSEARISMWRTMRELAVSGLSVPELASALANLPAPVPGQDTPYRLGDLPGMDAVHFRAWAKTLSLVDPDAAQYHAEGRLEEYVEQVDLDGALGRILCPVLLIQGDPSHGGIVTDGDVEHTLSLLADGLHVQLAGAGHDLGLDSWQVAPLLRALTNFVESLPD